MLPVLPLPSAGSCESFCCRLGPGFAFDLVHDVAAKTAPIIGNALIGVDVMHIPFYSFVSLQLISISILLIIWLVSVVYFLRCSWLD